MSPASAAPWVVGTRSSVRVLTSARADGDFHRERVPLPVLDARRRRLVDLPWTMPNEVHGTDVVVVERPGGGDGIDADAAVTALTDAVIGIWVGDCAPVALMGAEVVGGVHVGWRGLEAGVLERAVAAARHLDRGPLEAVLGPCIHACCYEFGDDDLERLVGRFGPAVEGTTRTGRRALDVPAAVAVALDRLGVPLADRSECTGCHADRYFSHRCRGEAERHVLAVWRASS